MLTRLSDEKIAERAVVCWVALKDHEQRSFQLVAQAQLETDQKEHDRIVREIFEMVLVKTKDVHSDTCQIHDGAVCDCRIGELRQALKERMSVK